MLKKIFDLFDVHSISLLWKVTETGHSRSWKVVENHFYSFCVHHVKKQ